MKREKRIITAKTRAETFEDLIRESHGTMSDAEYSDLLQTADIVSCEECEGSGAGRYHGATLEQPEEWDDCESCEGTGVEINLTDADYTILDEIAEWFEARAVTL